MRFSQPVHMSEGEASPVWARSKRRSGGASPIGFLVTLLALFGALTGVLGIKERSLAEGGAIIDGWITSAWTSAKGLAGQAPEAGEEAAEKVGETAAKTGDALQAGAEKTADELKKQ